MQTKYVTARVIAVVALLLAANRADAKLTPGGCLAQKRTIWATWRKCQANQQARALRGKTSDLSKCDTRFGGTFNRIADRAQNAGVPCRFTDNADGTVTDYDTGLMWEKKDGTTVLLHWTWNAAMTDFISACNGKSADGVNLGTGCPVYHDWRVPTVAELQGILNLSVPGCGAGTPCIDPIFGPTLAYQHWSSTTLSFSNYQAWYVEFYDGFLNDDVKSSEFGTVRAVRSAL
jgi:hypothetical protein